MYDFIMSINHDWLTIVTALAALGAACFQTYVRFTTRHQIRARGRDEYRWPRGFIGDATVLTSWIGLLWSPLFTFGNLDQFSGMREAGCTILLIAIAIRVWAQVILGSNWSNGVEMRIGHVLILIGPYRYVRHPMYTGYCLMAIGVTLASANAIAVALWLVFLPMLIKRARREEEFLIKKFGKAYIQYRAATPMLVPRIPRLIRSR